MVITGELAYIGGRTLHIGGAAMPLGSEPYSHDPLVQSRNSALYSRAAIGERQAVSMKALHSAFHRKYGEEGNRTTAIDPMTEACLALEETIGIMGYDAKVKHNDGRMRGNFSKEEINESLVMSTHRWIITVLPMRVIKQVGALANVYRDALKRYEPLVAMNECEIFPTPALAFGALNYVTDENRAEIGKWIIESTVDATSSEVLEYIHNQSGLMDSSCCFWCEKTKLTAERLFLCTDCMSVSYCSKECQKNDWKAFHKVECRQLSEKTAGQKTKTRDELGMRMSRSETLRSPGKAYYQIPIPIATEDDESNVFRGDTMTGYITSTDPTLTAKTKLFPLGLQVLPREKNASISRS
eukprot:scaffold44768_cov49-Cyclotella_meneghiniana.AAC.7